MGRLKNGLGRIPIAVAFVICGAGCLLAALALTKCTVSFAKRNILEIVSSYDLDPTTSGFIYFDDSVSLSKIPKYGCRISKISCKKTP